MSDRTIQSRPGYGATLRRQLDAVGLTQAQLAAKSSISRQTISRAVNGDEVSDRTRRKLAAALRRVPAKPRSQEGDGPRSSPSLSRGVLCDGTDLVDWADRHSAQTLLPSVIRRLIGVTGDGVTNLTMRTGEGVHLPGWDGIVHADRGAAFVPKGVSGWEMSAGRNPSRRAEENWAKRMADSGTLVPEEATFVFATPRRWAGKEEWAARKINEGPWRDVRVFDADDLTAWLEEAPAVHTWLSIQIGKIPRDSRDLRSHWEEWSGATNPALTRRFLLARHGDRVRDFHRRMANVNGLVFAIRAESRGEAISWLYCAIRELAPEQAEDVLARCLVVNSAEALRDLIAARSPLVLVPTFDPEELASAAARAGHAVVLPVDSSDPGDKADVLTLDPLFRQWTAEALEEMGIKHRRAYEMAGFARRSLTAFRRSMANSPVFARPAWSRPAVGRGLVPVLLAGGWRDSNQRDREVISNLGRRPYDEVVETLVQWSVGRDPLVRRSGDGDAWYLVSPVDAWRLLGQYILPDDLGRFETAATTVLGTVHPKLGLPAAQRWRAIAQGHLAEHSGFLSDGLARTLAIMGVHGGERPLATHSIRDASERIVRKLLEEANRDWKVWASLSAHLRLLAEAAPEDFLDAVHAGLEGPDPVLGNLFRSTGASNLGSQDHIELLWALEILAWSRNHLARVVPLLARLDRIDPESELRLSNGECPTVSHRPLAVLKAVFQSWSPQTSASLDERLAVLDGLRRSHGEVAWEVMQSMLPKLRVAGVRALRPSVRGWSNDGRRALGADERVRTVSEVVTRMLTDVGPTGRRWTELLQRLRLLPVREHDLVVAALMDLDAEGLDPEVRLAIWEALRSIIAWHRDHSTKAWAMPEEYLARLERVRDRFSPENPVALHAWLFTRRRPHVGAGETRKTPREVRRRQLSEERRKAVIDTLQGFGPSGLFRLAKAVESPYEVGFAAAYASSGLLRRDELLTRHLADAHKSLRQLAFGYARGRAHRRGDAWVTRQLKRADQQLTVDQKVELLLVLTPCSSTWRVAAEHGEDVTLRYWRRLTPSFFADEDLAEGVNGLVNAGRPFAAADLLVFDERVNKGVVPPEVVARILDAASSGTVQHDLPGPDFGSSAAFLLDVLRWADYDQTQLARLEWRLAPALSHHERNPDALHQLLSRDPKFFVEMLSQVYRAESEEPGQVSQEDDRRAESGYSVLEAWRTIPGHGDDGGIDAERLREWLDATLSELAAADRVRIGHRVIGEMLSASPQDADGTWPCTPVREIIDDLANPILEDGFGSGVYNSRGVVFKDPSAGGAAERALAERYDGFAAAIRMTHPRTARILRKVAEWYRRDASREDIRSDLIEEL